MKEHHYTVEIEWTGNKGSGTGSYAGYGREHTLRVAGKEDLHCSADLPFHGDGSKYNPEDMMVASLSACHMLWYLHLCADAGIVVTSYEDTAEGWLQMDSGPGRFVRAMLHPRVRITDASRWEEALLLHDEARKKCFIANSVNFPVEHAPVSAMIQ